jgi:aryl-alcohol dehydrogenase-like predicted oxidoreductase
MHFRPLGRTGMRVSEVGFGAWAIGGSWGAVDDKVSMRALHAALDSGVNFIDTADVYGMGHSERLVARLRRERPGDAFWVATKAGRKLPSQTLDGYTRENLLAWVDESRRNLETDTLELLQLHCPHPAVYDSDEVFGYLDDMVADGRIRHYGVSVETVDEGIRALRHRRLQSIQVIFNLFRQKPADVLFVKARQAGVGIIARVPLASGLLTGKLTADSTFAPDDHRQFNRHGEAFDKGETFSGVPYAVGLEAVEALRRIMPADMSMAQCALRWILMNECVSTVIPGGRSPEQARDNAAASDLAPLDSEFMEAARTVYDRYIREHVHQLW